MNGKKYLKFSQRKLDCVTYPNVTEKHLVEYRLWFYHIRGASLLLTC